MTTLQEYHFMAARSPFEITEEDIFLDVGCGFGRLGAVLKYVEDRKALLLEWMFIFQI